MVRALKFRLASLFSGDAKKEIESELDAVANQLSQMQTEINRLEQNVAELIEVSGLTLCDHGVLTEEGMCEKCYTDSDIAYDAMRE